MDQTNAARAEYLSHRRARMLPILAVMYLSQQGIYFSDTSRGRALSAAHAKLGAWAVLTVVLLLVLTTKGFWFHPREVRDMVDDEVTRAHRLDAIRIGFLFSVLTGVALVILDQFEPLSARETVHVIVSLGLGAALVRFGMLERRAQRSA